MKEYEDSSFSHLKLTKKIIIILITYYPTQPKPKINGFIQTDSMV